MRPPRVIAFTMNERVPKLAVSVQCAISMSLEINIISPEDPRRGLILVANRKGVVEPVSNIWSPLVAVSLETSEETGNLRGVCL